MPHEVLFTFRKGTVRDSRMRGMTSLNGVVLPDEIYLAVSNALEQDGSFVKDMSSTARANLAAHLEQYPEKRDRVNDVFTSFFEYVGVAITPCSAGSAKALQRQGFSATRGGLMTVMNTGLHTIYAGQKVKMVLDLVDVLRQGRGMDEMLGGIPRQKIVARLQPVKESPGVSGISSATVQQTTPVSVQNARGNPLLPNTEDLVHMCLTNGYAGLDYSQFI